MSDDVIRLSLVGQVLRRRWAWLLLYALVGAAVGFGASLVVAPGYQAQTQVLLQGDRSEDELNTEVEVVTSTVVLDKTAAALHWGVPGRDLRDDVDAESGGGNVIVIHGTAQTPERSQQLTDAVAKEYAAFSSRLATGSSSEATKALVKQLTTLRDQIALTDARSDEVAKTGPDGEPPAKYLRLKSQLESLRGAMADVNDQLGEVSQSATESSIVIMGRAERPASPTPPTPTDLTAGGAVLFLLLGLMGHVAARRADRRLRGLREIGAALGSDVATVVVPHDDSRVRSGLRAVRGAPAGEDADPDERFVEVLQGLPASRAGAKLLVIAAEDDLRAHRVIGKLVRSVGKAGAAHTALRVSHFAAEDVAIPKFRGVADVLVVLSEGSRTPWELVEVAESCRDAGYRLVSAVVVRGGDTRRRPPKRTANGSSARAVGSREMAGAS